MVTDMNLLVENGIIEEKKRESNFSYVLTDNSYFVTIEYKFLQNQSNVNFLKCMKLLYNGKIELYYLTSQYRSLASIVTQLDANSFTTIVINLLANIISTRTNGYLKCYNIDSSYEHIYIEPSTMKVRLIYLPLSKHEYDDEAGFENAIRTSLIKLISTLPNLNGDKTLKLSLSLQNGVMSLDEICTQFGMKTGGSGTTGYLNKNISTSTNAETVSKEPSKIRLLSLNTASQIVFEIDKDSFSIGKRETNDGVIINNLISRAHCTIYRTNGSFEIEDVGSSNGTYVNGVKLQANVKTSINVGDVIKLANIEFKVFKM